MRHHYAVEGIVQVVADCSDRTVTCILGANVVFDSMTATKVCHFVKILLSLSLVLTRRVQCCAVQVGFAQFSACFSIAWTSVQ